MMTDRGIQQREEAIFDLGRRIEDPDVRAAYLEQACGGDSQLQSRIGELIGINLADDSLLDHSPVVSRRTVTELNQPMEEEGQSIGSYQLLQKLGEGGFGVVFMAEQVEPVRRKVALKIIKPGMESSDVIARFEAERQALALMNHPNIASVYDGGRTPSGRPFFVMELVRGVSITEYCDKKNLSPQQRINLFIDVCSAIQHAHQKGVIHRDLKPSNVMITLHDGTPVVKVIDFGVAKAINQELTDKMYFTRYGQMIGTPQYMSPEQAEMSGLGIDTLSDVYSLGVLLYELLVGTTPLLQEQLRDAGYKEMQRLICEVDPAIPSKRLSTTCQQELIDIADRRNVSPEGLTEEIRGDLELIVMKTLAKERDRRYATPSDLTRDLVHFLNNEPIDARPPSVGYRFQKFVQRNRPTVIATISTAAALFVAGLTCFTLLIKERRLTAEKDVAIALLDAERMKVVAVNRNLDDANRKLSNQKRALENQYYRTQIQQASQAIQEFKLLDAQRILSECPERCRDWEWKRLDYLSSDSAKRVRGTKTPIFLGENYVLTLNSEGQSGAIDFWNIKTGEKKDQLPIAGSGTLVSNAISPDKSTIAVADAVGKIFVIDLATREFTSFDTKHRGRIDGMAFTFDGKRLVSASRDGSIKLFDLQGGLVTEKHTNAHLRCVAIDPQGRFIATATSSSVDESQDVVRIWDAKNLDPIDEIPMDNTASTVCFDASGERLALGGGQFVLICEYVSQKWTVRNQYRHSGGHIRAICFRPNQNRLMIGSIRGVVEWDLDDDLARGVSAVSRQVFWMKCSPRGRYVAYNSGGNVTIRDLERQLPGRSVRLHGLNAKLSLCAKFNHDDTRLAVAGDSRTITIFDMTGELAPQSLHGHQETIACLEWDETNHLYSLDGTGMVIAWEQDGQRKWTKTFDVRTSPSYFYLIANLSGRNRIALGTQLQNLLLLNTEDGTIADTIDTEGVVRSIAVDPSVKWLAWCDDSQQVSLYDLDRKTVLKRFEIQDEGARQLAFSPDSKLIAGVGNENSWVFDLTANRMSWEVDNQANCWGIKFTNSGERVIVSAGTKHDYAAVRDVRDGFILDKISTDQCFDFAYNRTSESLFFYGYDGYAMFVPPTKDAAEAVTLVAEQSNEVSPPYWMMRRSREIVLKTAEGTQDEAVKLAAKAVRLVPNCAEYELTYGMALFRDGRFSDAKNAFDKIAPGGWNNNATREDYPPARLELIRVLFVAMNTHSLGDFERARSMLENAREAMESSTDTLLQNLLEEAALHLDRDPVESGLEN